MWLGLLDIDDHPADGEAGAAVVVVYPDDGRTFTVGSAHDGLPSLLRTLRQLGRESGHGRPRCTACGEDLGLPDLDGS